MNIGGRFWLEDNGKAFVGRGRVELLEKIRDHGSINAAATSMKMAYKAAWDAVDAINRVASQPVVLRNKRRALRRWHTVDAIWTCPNRIVSRDGARTSGFSMCVESQVRAGVALVFFFTANPCRGTVDDKIPHGSF